MTVSEPVPDTFEDAPAHNRGPNGLKRAVCYEVLVRSLQNSDGDGAGDPKGRTTELDYRPRPGAGCLWPPSFFTSPLRDSGVHGFYRSRPARAVSRTGRRP